MRRSTLVLIGVAIGWFVTYQYFSREIADMQRIQAIAVKEAEESHARKLAKATDTIVRAQSDFATVRAERDRALERLRNHQRTGADTRSVNALRSRVAELEDMVRRLAEAGSKCDDGWHRCAARYDALTQVLKE